MPKLAFEIRPSTRRWGRRREAPTAGRATAASAARAGAAARPIRAPRAGHRLVERARPRRPRGSWRAATARQFPATPARVAAPQRAQAISAVRGIRWPADCAAAPRLIQPSPAGPSLAWRVNPFVAGLATDAVVRTQLSHRPAVPLPIRYEMHATDSRATTPATASLPPANEWRKVLPMSSDCFVTYVSGLNPLAGGSEDPPLRTFLSFSYSTEATDCADNAVA